MRELESYDGSKLLQPLASLLGLGIDQLNFVVCQLVALLLGFPYRTFFGPHVCDVRTRHILQIALGLPLAYFCFGSQILHLLAQSVSCYVLMRTLRPGVMEKVVFAVVMGYLCIAHLYRQYYDYGGYVLDITGPLMVNTQRLTSLAFSYADGHKLKKNEASLTGFLKRHAIRDLPGTLEYFSYAFSFHMLLVGPFAFFDDYCKFVDGSNVSECEKSQVSSGSVGANHSKVLPSPLSKVLQKLGAAFFFGFVMLVVLPKYDVFFLLEPGFQEYSLPMKMVYIVFCTTLTRSKYYLAWKLAEALNVNAGLAFNGYDEQGKARWDLVDNVNVLKLEFGSSMKSVFDHWNIQTSQWLRYVVYERVRSTLFVFMLSAFWHGFYPGYYVTFFTGAISVNAGRVLRRNLRPYFQKSAPLARLYDLITTVASRLCLAYAAFPFVLLDIGPSLGVYRQLYFGIHVCLAVILGAKSLGLFPHKGTQGAAMTTTSPRSSPAARSPHDNQPNGTAL